MLSSQKKEIEDLVDGLLNNLSLRSRDILEKRFGLQQNNQKQTLESIGQFYNITRERVRQLENSAKELIAESEKFKEDTKKILNKLKKTLDNFGGVVLEDDFLRDLSQHHNQRNHFRFLMELADSFYKDKKQEFKDNIWFTNQDNYEGFLQSFDNLYKKIDSDELLSREEIVGRFFEELKKHTSNKNILKEEVIKKLLKVSKKIDSNKLEQWGLSESRNISGKSAKDYVYLILNREGQPMHFRDIAETVRQQFASDIRTASCHNELIKDRRFIIIGRGIYGLKEWKQYSGDTVWQVIKEILKKAKKPLSSEEIIEKVLERKQVKKQTILINLGNRTRFKKLKNGKYDLK